ncbi:hypothetical protein [Variovorax boronicumulans]|uniref:hypothetical protein n=1 Tax=Variovorax boronicumulans TaxID=436515 RepID=UPI001C580FBF
MKQIQTIARIAEWAEAGGAMPMDKELAALAAVMDHLDTYNDTYEADTVVLLNVRAAI